MTQSKNTIQNINRSDPLLNPSKDFGGNNSEPLSTQATSYTPTSAAQEFAAASQQSIAYCVQSMGAQDNLDSFKKLREIVKQSGETSETVTNRKIQNLWQRLHRQAPQDAFFLKELAQLGFLSPNNSAVHPAGYYFVNEKLKAAYCSIPKNACTLFKNMLVDNSDLKIEFETLPDRNVHNFLNEQIPRGSARHLLSCLGSSDYFKFVVLRNPFHRVVSAYLDKIAKHRVPESFVQEVVLDVQASLGLPKDIETSITFSQFIDYLVRTPDSLLNDHWRPQYNFVAAVEFDFIGQFESLDTVIATLEKTLDVRIRRRVSNHITNYKYFDSALDFHHMYPKELRRLEGGMPVAKNLFTRDLTRKFQMRYERDIELYDRHFQADSSNL